MVFARDRFDFFDRVRFALGPDRRTHRIEWNYSSARISPGGPRPIGRPRIVDLADTLLVQLERHLSPFSLWRRSYPLTPFDRRNRARAVAGRARCFLSVTDDRRANVPQFSVGHSSDRDRFLVDLSRAMAALAKARNGSTRFARRTFSAQGPALQTDSHVRRGEAHQRRRFVVEPDCARLSLLVAAIANRDRLVGRSKS